MAEPDAIDLEACAIEPIRIPGAIQPHGALLVVDPRDTRILHSSTNAASLLGLEPDRPLAGQMDGPVLDWLLGDGAQLLRSLERQGRQFQVVGHRSRQGAVLEFEEIDGVGGAGLEDIYPIIQRFTDAITGLDDLPRLGQVTADALRDITGFNRVLLYDFDPEWHGTVFAESRDETLPSYLGLRFPASDIPAQARELYRLNTLRIIPDANYVPVPVEPAVSPVDGAPLDLSFAVLRSVSPVHLEYMRNMGTLASMSISILVDGRLWGLISCHNAEPRHVTPQVRAACNIFARLFSLKMSALLRGAHATERIRLKQRETELVARLSRAETLEAGLVGNAEPWLALTGASSAAIVSEQGVDGVGPLPDEEALRQLASWLEQQNAGDVFATDSLSRIWPPAAEFAGVASGLVAISISQLHPSFVFWFRPEVERTISWSGDPQKPVDRESGRLTPRRSFAIWKEQVRGRSAPWSAAEIESAMDFRGALINFVLRRAEERAELTDELERINSELEAFSYSVSHDLRAPFRHIVGYAELLRDHDRSLDDKAQHYLANIIGAALSAGQLVDDLLNFSQLGRANLEKRRIDMTKLVAEVRHSIENDLVGREVEWVIGPLPPGWGDAGLIRQALANLIENAVKYTRPRDVARITISGRQSKDGTTYWVADNGVGFDMTYAGKLFGVFQRLHRMEEFEGTGIGLALTRRIVERHGGQVSARAEPDRGATFSFTLPNPQPEAAHA